MEALAIIAKLMEFAMSALAVADKVQQLEQSARAEGRELTLEDLKTIEGLDDTARDHLTKAIEEAEAG